MWWNMLIFATTHSHFILHGKIDFFSFEEQKSLCWKKSIKASNQYLVFPQFKCVAIGFFYLKVGFTKKKKNWFCVTQMDPIIIGIKSEFNLELGVRPVFQQQWYTVSLLLFSLLNFVFCHPSKRWHDLKLHLFPSFPSILNKEKEESRNYIYWKAEIFERKRHSKRNSYIHLRKKRKYTIIF